MQLFIKNFLIFAHLCGLTSPIQSMTRQLPAHSSGFADLNYIKSSLQTQIPIVLVSIIIDYLSVPVSKNTRLTKHQAPLTNLCILTGQVEVTTSDKSLEIYNPTDGTIKYSPNVPNILLLCTLSNNNFAVATQTGEICLYAYDEVTHRYNLVPIMRVKPPVKQLAVIDHVLHVISKKQIATWNIATGQELSLLKKPALPTKKHEIVFGLFEAHISKDRKSLRIVDPQTKSNIMTEQFPDPITKVISINNRSFAVLFGNSRMKFSINQDPKDLCFHKPKIVTRI